MKISETLLQVMTIAIIGSALTACKKDKLFEPKDPKKDKKEVEYSCPACGRG